MSVTLPQSIILPEPASLPIAVADGASAEVLLQVPAGLASCLLYWVPAMGVAAKHYLPLAQALASGGVAVAIHEWRGIGSSNRRAGRAQDWGYRQLLRDDLPAGLAAARASYPGLPCVIGGHSLGGQLGTVYTGLHAREFSGLLLVASGAPYWRRFRYSPLVKLFYMATPLLARLVGYLPGRRMGFGGNEARGVIADWARSGRTGRYAATGMSENLEQAMADAELPVLALRMRDDWLAPQASLDWLLGKMPRADVSQQVFTPEQLAGRPADHFDWMKAPAPVAASVLAWLKGLTTA